MMVEQQRRRLLRHGFRFLFLALFIGLAIIALPHPQKWLAAHLVALLTAVVLVAIGHTWRELALTPRQRVLAYRCGIVAAYAGLASNIWSALVDVPGPASNPGVQPAGVPGLVFFTLFAIIVPTIIVSFGMVLYGMRGDAAPEASHPAVV
jgi:hypothetical protein